MRVVWMQRGLKSNQKKKNSESPSDLCYYPFTKGINFQITAMCSHITEYTLNT